MLTAYLFLFFFGSPFFRWLIVLFTFRVHSTGVPVRLNPLPGFEFASYLCIWVLFVMVSMSHQPVRVWLWRFYLT